MAKKENTVCILYKIWVSLKTLDTRIKGFSFRWKDYHCQQLFYNFLIYTHQE